MASSVPQQLEPRLISDLVQETNPQLTHLIPLQDPTGNMAGSLSLASLKDVVAMTPLQLVAQLDLAFGTTTWRSGFSPQSGQLELPTIGMTTTGDSLSGTATAGTIITLENPVGGAKLVNSSGVPVSTTVNDNGTWALSDIHPDLGDGQTVRVRSTSLTGDSRSADLVVDIGVLDTQAPTGSVAFIFPNGTQAAPNTTLAINASFTDNITPAAALPITYQWGYLNPVSNAFQNFAGAVQSSFDPVQAGENPASPRQITCRVQTEDASGNVATFFPPKTAIAQVAFIPSAGAEVIYNYVENPF